MTYSEGIKGTQGKVEGNYMAGKEIQLLKVKGLEAEALGH